MYMMNKLIQFYVFKTYKLNIYLKGWGKVAEFTCKR